MTSSPSDRLRDPPADRLHDVATLGVVERAPGGEVVPACQAGATARRGGVLCDERGMPAVGRLTAVVARFGRASLRSTSSSACLRTVVMPRRSTTARSRPRSRNLARGTGAA
jgi:hypothetical protein